MFKPLFMITGLLLITACGGGGSDTDERTPAPGSSASSSSGGAAPVIDPSTTDLAEASIELTKNAIASKLVGGALGSAKMQNTRSTQYKADDEVTTVLGSCGGSATTRTSGIDSQTYPLSFTTDIIYLDYCYSVASYEFVYNGEVNAEFYYESAQVFRMSYSIDMAFTSNYPGYSQGSLLSRQECEQAANSDMVCTDYIENASKTYSLRQAEITGDDVNGYSFSSTFTSTDGVTYAIAARDILICDGGTIGSGHIEVVVDGDTATVDFISCSEYTVTYRGVSQTYTQ